MTAKTAHMGRVRSWPCGDGLVALVWWERRRWLWELRTTLPLGRRRTRVEDRGRERTAELAEEAVRQAARRRRVA